ncbi:MAG: hypothetical protein P8X69_11165, partial [Maritimibacter sp.]
MTKRLDRKLATIRAGAYTPTDFIIADAKDGDMAFGCAAPGIGANGRLTDQGVFAESGVTPAVRLNDTTDIWRGRGASYAERPARPFRSAVLERVKPVADLGLYAVTFYNDLEQDIRTLEEYARFRDEASAAGVRHFLEVFNPAMAVDTTTGDFASYNNDMIARILAGVSRLDRPIFLKAVYNGPAATEEIAGYDPENLVFGILGGG